MKKNYVAPETKVYEVQVPDLCSCSICDHPGNHYGHHKNNNVREEEEVSTNFLWNENDD